MASNTGKKVGIILKIAGAIAAIVLIWQLGRMAELW